ncbi:hypothetical protein C9J85_11845 [Haloferax sp. wsp5]|nr:hypothetical protein C9J85_11845 [Haloferax sp. wsp5]
MERAARSIDGDALQYTNGELRLDLDAGSTLPTTPRTKRARIVKSSQQMRWGKPPPDWSTLSETV